MAVTIKTNYAQDERLGENFAADVDWINQRRLELYEQYGDCVLLVYHQEVIGHGADVKEAIAEAEQNLSHLDHVVTPIVKYLSTPYRIGMYRRKTD